MVNAGTEKGTIVTQKVKCDETSCETLIVIGDGESPETFKARVHAGIKETHGAIHDFKREEFEPAMIL